MFKDKVYKVIRNIKLGSVLSYAEVARRAGSPQAARAVGTLCAKNRDKTIPCHRVIRSDGKIGKYNGLQAKNKETILKKEGYSK